MGIISPGEEDKKHEPPRRSSHKLGLSARLSSISGFVPLLIFCLLFTMGGIAPLLDDLLMFPPTTAALQAGLADSLAYSLAVALLSSLLAAVSGYLLALGVYFSRGWLRLAGQVYRIPLILPHISIAYLVLLMWSPGGIFSALLHSLGVDEAGALGSWIFYSGRGWAVMIAYVLKEIPFVMVMVLGSLAQLDRRLLMSAKNLGGRPVQILKAVLFPYSLGALLTAFIIIFLYSLGAYEIPFLVGESHPGMLSVLIFRRIFHPNPLWRQAALAFSLLVYLGSFIILYTFIRLNRQHFLLPSSMEGSVHEN